MAGARMGETEDRPSPRRDQDEPQGSTYVHPPYREAVKVSRVDLGRIGRHLQAMYQALASEPVPDHLTDLIHRLEQQRQTDERRDRV